MTEELKTLGQIAEAAAAEYGDLCLENWPQGDAWSAAASAVEAEVLRRQAIPAGWQLVPIEPTPEMLASQHGTAAELPDSFRADACKWMDHFTRLTWAKLLAAAPGAAVSPCRT
jgi:hypothetical protein